MRKAKEVETGVVFGHHARTIGFDQMVDIRICRE